MTLVSTAATMGSMPPEAPYWSQFFCLRAHLQISRKFGKVNTPWATLAMERGWDKRHLHLQRENPEAHSARFCRASPAPLKSFTHGGHKHSNSPLIASSSSSGSLPPLPYSCSLESPHQSTTCIQVPISGFAVIGNSN